MTGPNRFSSYRYGEGKTAIGQMVTFTCHPDEVGQVSEFLRTHIRSIDIPITGQVNVAHGSYGRYTRYDVKQHKYAGGGSGYIEVLEIKNPPDDRCNIVINEYTEYKGSVFTEWKTLESAIAAFEKYWGDPDQTRKFAELPGFKRRVVCGELTPWFYAIGDQQLIGDYALPESLHDDPVYRLGRQFVVFDDDGAPAVKTCMGTRFVDRKRNCPPYGIQQFRLVYWDDGSAWYEGDPAHHGPPRLVEEGELWITEAVYQFRQLLAGKKTEFAIDFTDGNKFVGKLTRAKPRSPCAEGNYLLSVQIKDKKGLREGWVKDFKPTHEAPDIVQFVTQQYLRGGQEVEHIKIKGSQIKKGGKKWSGVFFHHPR